MTNKKMSRKSIGSIAIVYAILLAVYTLIVLAVPFEKPAASWVVFGFSELAFFLSFGVTVWAFKDTKPLRSLVYGFPIFKVGALYLGLQCAASVILYIIGAFVNVPVWIAVIVCVVLLAVFAIGFIGVSATRDTIVQMEDEVETKTKAVKYFNIDIATAASMAEDPELKKALEKLAEDFRYSDPVSGEATELKEAEIKGEMGMLTTLVKNGETEAAIAKAKRISLLLDERNRLCKAFK